MDSDLNPSEIQDQQHLHLSIELTNRCNLQCSYCIRDDDALYHAAPVFFEPELIDRMLTEACHEFSEVTVSFTGGEPTIHPRFSEILTIVSRHGCKFNFVTNGWLFERVHKAVAGVREAVDAVAFSVDGATIEDHDRWRGKGSFVRVVRAMALCRAQNISFSIKAAIRRDTVPNLEQIALMAARFGAKALLFSHIWPTSDGVQDASGLTLNEQAEAEHEIAILSNIFKMKVGISAGYYNVDEKAPCLPLRGISCNVDYLGRMTLCCNLSGYRGGENSLDVVADLNHEPFLSSFDRLRELASLQLERRAAALRDFEINGLSPDLSTGSPCLFCYKSFGKIPWHDESAKGNVVRALPILNSRNTRQIAGTT
jgi:MoaA/NifB/PqqE/SkfB family radical SAM enzyme